ncbi:MAG: MFS transporter [Sedimentisphaerales bacterium]|nr:MFS transporter [Sedimentisphaerales bacterium]
MNEAFQSVRQDRVGVWPLYGAAFAMAISLNVLWTAMPFIIRNIGGTEEHVGYVWAANMLGYMVCLLFAATVLDHLNARYATRTATASMFLATVVMTVVVWYVLANHQSGNVTMIWTVIAAGVLAGAAMSLFWPFLMSWVSADYEGVVLNRRLGTYNGMWSAAAILGPSISGVLVDNGTLDPIVAGLIGLAICFVLLWIAHDESAGTAASTRPLDAPESHFDETMLPRFKWMARIALFCSWACLGVSRSQFALLFTGLGFSETQFGIMITVFGICNFATLTGAGRLGFWHFKLVYLLIAQVILIVPLLLLIFGRTLWVFVPSFMVMGFGFGFAYSSHLYYGACGSRKRSARMAIHEVTLSLGVVVGSGVGGYLSGNVGQYWPYWFAVTILAAGLVAQVVVWIALKPKRHRTNLHDNQAESE